MLVSILDVLMLSNLIWVVGTMNYAVAGNS